MIQDYPSDAPHGSAGLEVLFPAIDTAELLLHLFRKPAGPVHTAVPFEVLEIEFMQPHAVELPSEPSFELGIFRCACFPVFQHLRERLSGLVRVGNISL